MRVLTPLVVMAGVVVAGVSHAHSPSVRETLNERKRLPWVHEEAELNGRQG